MTGPDGVTEDDRDYSPFVGIACVYCGGGPIYLHYVFEAKKLGTYSVAGSQLKVTGSFWPYATCEGCGHRSRGKVSPMTDTEQVETCDACGTELVPEVTGGSGFAPTGPQGTMQGTIDGVMVCPNDECDKNKQ